MIKCCMAYSFVVQRCHLQATFHTASSSDHEPVPLKFIFTTEIETGVSTGDDCQVHFSTILSLFSFQIIQYWTRKQTKSLLTDVQALIL